MDYKELYKELVEAQNKSDDSWSKYRSLNIQINNLKDELATYEDDGRFWSDEAARVRREMDEGIKE